MACLLKVLPVILNILGIALLIVLIIIGIKIIKVMNNIDEIVKDVDYKVKSLNNIFTVIDKTTDCLAIITDKVVSGISNFILKFFKKKYNKEKEDSIDEE